MRSVKSRNWSTEQDEDLAVIMEDLQRNQKKLTWNQIAVLLHQNNASTSKTGKQCRERQLKWLRRWTNQINPEVKRFTEWSKEENQILFSLHHRLGNKWSEISEKLPGRTDNCIKNHFYSVMRGGLRKINVYIENVKRKQVLVKTFKNEILNKVLTICEGKNNEKFQLSTQAQELAFTVKKNLVMISLDQTEQCPKTIEQSENLYNLICEFARNCRRKKSKKVNESDFYSDDSQEKEKKKKRNSFTKKKKESQNCNEQDSESQQPNYQVKLPSQQNKFKEQSDCLNENQNAIQKEESFDLKNELKQSDNNLFGTKSDCQINQLEKADKQIHIEQPILGSASYNFPLRSNSNYFNFGNINIEASQDWARNSGLLENKNAVTSFINTVPDVTNKKVQFEGENKKGELDFSNYHNFPIPPSQFEYIFRKQINLFPIPDVAKSYDLEKSFNFSNSIKQSPIFVQGPSEASKLDINLQALFSSSSIHGTPLPMQQLANSSGFSMWSGFGKESQQIKLKSTKCDIEQQKLENSNEKGQ